MKKYVIILLILAYQFTSLGNLSARRLENEKAKRAIEAIRATYECIESQNPLIVFLSDYQTDKNGTIIGQEIILYRPGSITNAAIILTQMNKGQIKFQNQIIECTLNWGSDYVESVTFKSRGGKFNISYENNVISQVAKEKILDLSKLNGMWESKYKEFWILKYNNDKLISIDRRLKPVELKTGSYYKCEKDISYSSDKLSLHLVSYKAGKFRKPRNIDNDSKMSFSLNKPYVIESTSGPLNRQKSKIVQFDTENRKIKKTELFEDKKSITTTYTYLPDGLSEYEAITTKKDKLFEKVISKYVIDTNTNKPVKTKMKYNKKDELIYESKGTKYREKVKGVWSAWKSFSY